MTFALGIAFRGGPLEPVPVAVVAGPAAEATRAGLAAGGEIEPRVMPAAEAETALRTGATHLVVVPGTPPTFRFDPTRPESRLARALADAALQAGGGRRDLWEAHAEAVVAPGSRYVDWVVPGLIGMNIMGTGMWGIGFGVVQARSRKLLKRLVAAPMRQADYLLSHMLSRLLFLVLEVGAVVAFGALVFDVPVRGSLAALGLVSLLGAVTFSGIGLLVASRTKTIEAVSGLMNLVMVPMWILSGVFFSSTNFPDAAQPLIKALPLTALNDALRGVMLDGAGLAGLLVPLGIMAAWSIATFTVALKIFRWR
jgi:ABC-type multidrug transport system permease subunit